MGAAAGVGGIGFDMFMASGFYFDLSEIGAITYFVLIIAICLENFATQNQKEAESIILILECWLGKYGLCQSINLVQPPTVTFVS